MNLLSKSFLFLSLVSNASVIELFDTNTTVYNISPNLSYTISARYQLIDTDNLKKRYRFFNRKKVIKRYHYQKDGIFRYKNFSLNFQKSYRVNNKLYFSNPTFKLDSITTKAKECYIDINKMDFLRCKNVRYYNKNKIVKTKIRFDFVII